MKIELLIIKLCYNNSMDVNSYHNARGGNVFIGQAKPKKSLKKRAEEGLQNLGAKFARDTARKQKLIDAGKMRLN